MIILIILCANIGRMDAQAEASSRNTVPSDMAFDADTLCHYHKACFAEVDSLAKCADFLFVKTNPVGWGMLIAMWEWNISLASVFRQNCGFITQP